MVKRKKSIKSRIKSFVKNSGAYTWNKSRMAATLLLGFAIAGILTYFALKLHSLWNWTCVAASIVWTLFATSASTKSTKKSRVSGNKWTSEREKAYTYVALVGFFLLVTIFLTLLADILIVTNVTSIDSVHSILSASAKWLGHAALRCILVLAAFLFTLWGVKKFIEAMIEEEARNPTSCHDCIILLIATGVEAYFLGNGIANHIIAMI
jgi:hypothetical protein